jgi:Ser/Thr protein kinase RdoA (MazF antagonist)
VHRDFYDKQVLCLDDAAPAVIDLDTAARGDREIDVANFCAHLRFRALQHGREPLYAELEDAFLGAYPATLDRHRLDWYRRATLVRLACNYALRPRWRHVAPRALALVLGA